MSDPKETTRNFMVFSNHALEIIWLLLLHSVCALLNAYLGSRGRDRDCNFFSPTPVAYRILVPDQGLNLVPPH